MSQPTLSTSALAATFGFSLRTRGWSIPDHRRCPASGPDAAQTAWENEGGRVRASEADQPDVVPRIVDR